MRETPEALPTQRRNFNSGKWLWIASAFTFLAVAMASCWMSGPIIHADEGGYLLNAAAIAGKFRSSVIWGSYYAGYSLFLTPAWWLFSDPRHIYHACLIINALLLATMPAGLYCLLSALAPGSNPRALLLAAVAAAWQAPVLAMGQLAFSENALIPVYVWSLALLTRAARDRSTSLTVAGGAMIGYLFVVHPRGALLAVPVLAVMVIHAIRNRFPPRQIAYLMVSAASAAALHWPLTLLAGKHGAAQGSNYGLAEAYHHLLASFSWGRLGVDLLGVTAYALVSSVVFVALGLLTRRVAGADPAARATAIGTVMAFLACVVATAVFCMGGSRIDYIIYGRYVVPAMIPLVGCGVLVFLQGPKRLAWFAAGATMLLIALLGWMFHLLPLPPRSPWMSENVIGLYPPLKLAGGLHWTTVAIYLVAFFAIIEITRLLSANAAICSFVLINLALAGTFIVLRLQPESYARDHERVLVRAVAETEATSGRPLCLTLSPAVDHWHMVDYRFWLYRNIPQSTTIRTNCIRAEIAPLSPDLRGTWQLVARAQRRSMGLFISAEHGIRGKPRPLQSIIGTPFPDSH